MHNLLSRSQLNEWRHFETTIDGIKFENHLRSIDKSINRIDNDTEKLNDYYECLVECDVLNEPQCKRICRKILS